jgi:hypothetical protein
MRAASCCTSAAGGGGCAWARRHASCPGSAPPARPQPARPQPRRACVPPARPPGPRPVSFVSSLRSPWRETHPTGPYNPSAARGQHGGRQRGRSSSVQKGSQGRPERRGCGVQAQAQAQRAQHQRCGDTAAARAPSRPAPARPPLDRSSHLLFTQAGRWATSWLSCRPSTRARSPTAAACRSSTRCALAARGGARRGEVGGSPRGASCDCGPGTGARRAWGLALCRGGRRRGRGAEAGLRCQARSPPVHPALQLLEARTRAMNAWQSALRAMLIATAPLRRAAEAAAAAEEAEADAAAEATTAAVAAAAEAAAAAATGTAPAPPPGQLAHAASRHASGSGGGGGGSSGGGGGSSCSSLAAPRVGAASAPRGSRAASTQVRGAVINDCIAQLQALSLRAGGAAAAGGVGGRVLDPMTTSEPTSSGEGGGGGAGGSSSSGCAADSSSGAAAAAAAAEAQLLDSGGPLPAWAQLLPSTPEAAAAALAAREGAPPEGMAGVFRGYVRSASVDLFRWAEGAARGGLRLLGRRGGADLAGGPLAVRYLRPAPPNAQAPAFRGPAPLAAPHPPPPHLRRRRPAASARAPRTPPRPRRA